MTKTQLLAIIDTALTAIVEMDDADTFDEQCDCITPLSVLRGKIKMQIKKEESNK